MVIQNFGMRKNRVEKKEQPIDFIVEFLDNGLQVKQFFVIFITLFYFILGTLII